MLVVAVKDVTVGHNICVLPQSCNISSQHSSWGCVSCRLVAMKQVPDGYAAGIESSTRPLPSVPSFACRALKLAERGLEAGGGVYIDQGGAKGGVGVGGKRAGCVADVRVCIAA